MYIPIFVKFITTKHIKNLELEEISLMNDGKKEKTTAGKNKIKNI